MKITNFLIYKEAREKIKKQCENTHMWTLDSHAKKINAILDSICIAVINTELSLENIEEIIKDINTNSVIDTSILTKGGNLWNFVKQKWVTFAKDLFRQRTVGIGTPNAASGEGELMFLFLAGAEVTKPTKGDLKFKNKIFELKGEGPRIMGNISGNNFRKKTLECAKKYGILPNKSVKTNVLSVELEKSKWTNYYFDQLKKLTLDLQKSFCNEWMGCIDGKDHKDQIEKVYKKGLFNFEIFKKEIIKSLFRIHLQCNPFDYYVILGDGSNVKIFSSNLEEFDNKIDSGEIIICEDYFRVNQNFPIAWYIK